MKKNFIAAAICGLGLLASGAASAIVIEGVNFSDNLPGKHLEGATLAETLITGSGQSLTGYGLISTVNDLPSYTTTPGNYLYFIARDYISTTFVPQTVTADGAINFSGGVIDVYLGAFKDLGSSNSTANISYISGLTQYVRLAGHTNAANSTISATGNIQGTTISFKGNGFLDVVPGFGFANAVNFLNTNTINDGHGGFADITFTSSGDNTAQNSNDPACRDRSGAFIGTAGQFCVRGVASLAGATAVPEPGVLAMLGLGLLGMGASLRKRKSA